jgi:hypothetical protein
MAHIGYDPAYAAAKLAQVDEQIAAHKAEGKRLTELRKQYATEAAKPDTTD